MLPWSDPRNSHSESITSMWTPFNPKQFWHLIQKIIIVSVMLCGSPFISSAQQHLVVSGAVMDSKSMTPIPNAMVILVGTLHGALTSHGGRFEFVAIPPGEYLLSVSAEGYTPIQESVDVQEDSEFIFFISPVGIELPERHGFPSSNFQVSSNLFRSVLPRRLNAHRVSYTVTESEPGPKSYYLDGIRLLHPFPPLLALTGSDRIESIPTPYNLGSGMDAAIQYKAQEPSNNRIELIYDSKQRGFKSRGTFGRNWSRGFGILSATYSGSSDYSDGSGLIQQSALRSGNIAGRLGIKLNPDQTITGSAGWIQDLSRTGEDLHQSAAFFQYNYSNKSGFFQGVKASLSFQQLEHELAEGQQSAAVSVRVKPWSSLRLNVGADYYRNTSREKSDLRVNEEHPRISSVDTGVFLTALHRVSQFLINVQYRLDSHNDQWAGSTSVTWHLGDEWNLLAGAGRVKSSGSERMLRQANLGISWEGFKEVVELMTFSRETWNNHSVGVTSFVQMPWWSVMTYTAVSNLASADLKPSWSSWARIQGMVQGPLDLFTFGSEIYGKIYNEPRWVSADVWVQLAEFSGASFQIRITNLFDGTFRYPHSEFAEPGRSVGITFRYQFM